MKNLTVGEVMDTAPPSIRAGQLLDEVVAKLIKHHVSGLPVVNENFQVIGFVSEHDCIHSLKVSSYHSDAMVPVEEVMNHEVYAVSPDMLLIDLVDTMETNKPKIFPVTEEGKLVGLITRPQVLLVLAESSIGCGFTYKVAH
jgi:CBS domain-containing protein